jgi:hypothetical protein
LGLQPAVSRIGCSPICGKKLGTTSDLITHGGNMVLPATASQKIEIFFTALVFRKEAFDMSLQTIF